MKKTLLISLLFVQLVAFSATRTISNAGGNFNSTGTWVEGIVPVAGDDCVATGTSGNLTVNVTSGGAGLGSFIMTGWTGNLVVSQALTISGTFTLPSTMGTITGASAIVCNTTATISFGGKTIDCGFSLGGTSQTYTAADNWSISGVFTILSTTSCTVNGAFTVTCSGGYNQNVSSICKGTASFKFTGGTWTGVSSQSLQNNLEIAGNLTMTNATYGAGTLTGTSGTITGTLFLTSSCTLNTSAITLATLNINEGITITLLSGLNCGSLIEPTGPGGTLVFSGAFNISCTSATLRLVTYSGNLTSTADVTFTAGSSVQTGFILTCGGTLTALANVTVSGTTNIVMNGTGSIVTANSNATIKNNLEINTAGTITISGTVNYGTGIFLVTAGTIAGSSTPVINFNSGTPTMTVNTAFNLACGISTTVSMTFNGSSTLTANSFTCITAGKTITHKAGNTYTWSTGLTITGTNTSKVNLVSSTPSSSYNYTLTSGATCFVSYCSSTDADSSGGRVIHNKKGTLLRTVNWYVVNPDFFPLMKR